MTGPTAGSRRYGIAAGSHNYEQKNGKADRQAFPLDIFSIVASHYAAIAFFAASTMVSKPLGSQTAISESDLRSSSMPALVTPFINWL